MSRLIKHFYSYSVCSTRFRH